MKTPREILFRRHESAETKLDAIREEAVRQSIATTRKKLPSRTTFSPASVMMKLWQELVWPCRRIWLGMAAVWVAILFFSFASAEPGVAVAGNATQPTPDEVMALKQQQQMMAQLLDAGSAEPATKPRVPGPRSGQRQSLNVG